MCCCKGGPYESGYSEARWGEAGAGVEGRV